MHPLYMTYLPNEADCPSWPAVRQTGSARGDHQQIKASSFIAEYRDNRVKVRTQHSTSCRLVVDAINTFACALMLLLIVLWFVCQRPSTVRPIQGRLR